MRIIKCRTNHLEHPLGYALGIPSVSWIVEDARSKRQSAARVIVSLTETMEDVIYDSGREEGLSSLGVELPIKLMPRTRYFWKVTVWGDQDEMAESAVHWFETGKMDEEWSAVWIGTDREEKIHPYIRKKLTLDKEVKTARIYACGLGAYEFYINGEKAEDEYLAPGCTSASEWVQSYTYDVTRFLHPGENVVGALLGNAWLKGHKGSFEMAGKPYADRFLLIAEVSIEYMDGSRCFFGTDDTWQWKESEILDSSIYNGESWDIRKAVTGWCTPKADCGAWREVEEVIPEMLGKLEDRRSLPIRVHETRKPVKVISTPAGETVLDFGQNMAGWVRFTLREPEGQKVTLSYGEILQNRNFYRDNLRTAKQQFTCISDGRTRIVEPHFTYYGFRYVKLEGFSEPVVPDDFMACAVYSDLEETGRIVTSDPLVNRLFLNAMWGQKSNFLDVPTDCPQRDERMGWTGDTQVFSGTANFNMDTYAFYKKYLYDIWKDQKTKNGMVGNVIPSFIPEQKEQSMPYYGGSAVWGDCAVILPWNLYLYYGDPAVLKEQYESMAGWVNWVNGRIEKNSQVDLWEGDYQWGDWLALDGPIKDGTEGGTDAVFIATTYFKHSADIVSKAANILGKIEDEKKYRSMAEQAKQAIMKEYFSANGRATVNTQTAGSVVEWIYRYVCGIQPSEDAPGFTRFFLHPQPDGSLFGAKAEYDSPKGKIAIGWRRSRQEDMQLKITVPFDTKAQLRLPKADFNSIKGLEGFQLRQSGPDVYVELDAGKYEISYMFTQKYTKCYSTQDTLEDLKKNPDARKALYEAFPMVDMIPAEFLTGNKPFIDVLNGTIRLSGMVDVDALIKELNDKLGAVPYAVRSCPFEL